MFLDIVTHDKISRNSRSCGTNGPELIPKPAIAESPSAANIERQQDD